MGGAESSLGTRRRHGAATALGSGCRVLDYDLLVIGCGPAGQKAALAAAQLGKRAAAIERADTVGGVCINTGTIPSNTLRETVLYLTGLLQRRPFGQHSRVKSEITMDDLSAR